MIYSEVPVTRSEYLGFPPLAPIDPWTVFLVTGVIVLSGAILYRVTR